MHRRISILTPRQLPTAVNRNSTTRTANSTHTVSRVTFDKRIFAYRDGIQVATLRASDYGNQAEWAVETVKSLKNLLKNSNFEGEYMYVRQPCKPCRRWIVDPIDRRYNCTYDVANLEIDNELDPQQPRHGSSSATTGTTDGAQVQYRRSSNVAPNSTYSPLFAKAA